jgi:predicted transcriptional regulator
MISLTNNTIKLLKYLDNHDFVTKSTKPFITNITYYNSLWALRDLKCATCDGTNDDNQKKWFITEKGKQLAFHIKKIEELVTNG